jgi:hypothetical protein
VPIARPPSASTARGGSDKDGLRGGPASVVQRGLPQA